MELDLTAVEETQPAAPKATPKPKIEELEEELQSLKTVNTLRNNEIMKHRRVTRQYAPQGGKLEFDENSELVRLSIPNSVVSETARVIGKNDPLIEFVSESTAERDERIASNIEAFLRWAEGKFAEAYQRGGGQDALAIARARMLVQDGRLVSILTLRPEDPSFPFRLRLVDPTEMHFRWGDDKIVRAWRTNNMTAQQIQAEWGVEMDRDVLRENPTYDVISYWDDTWYAIWVDRGKEKSPIELKTPVKHGYPVFPIIVTHVNGWIGMAESSPGQDSPTLEAYRGTGAFWPHENEYKRYLEVVDAQIHDTLIAAAPPLKAKLPPGNQAFEVEAEPNEAIMIPNGADVEYLWKTAGLPHARATSDLLSNVIQSGTLPVGEANFSSGFDRMIATQRGQSFFTPFIEGLKQHYRQMYRNVLLLFKEYGIPISITQPGPKGRTIKAEFTPFDIPNDPIVLVEFGDLAPVDIWQAISAATGAMASGILDEHTFWQTIIRHPQARVIIDRIRSARALAQQPVREQLVEVDAIEELLERAEVYKAKGMTDLENVVRMKADVLLNQVKMQLEQSLNPQPEPPQQPSVKDILAKVAPPAVPIEGLPGGNGSQGLPGQPELPGVPPQVMPIEAQTGGLNQANPEWLAAMMQRPMMGA